MPVFWHSMFADPADPAGTSAIHVRPLWTSSLARCLLAGVLAAGLSCREVPPEFDLVLRGGLVLDGTGAPAVRADVGVKADRIAAVADLADRTSHAEIDVTGLVVAPGFIDTQGQSGRTLLEDGSGESHIRQGITSEIIGEGSTPALWTPESADLAFLRRLNIPFDWPGFSGYLELLASRGTTVNVGSLAPLNQLRADTMGLARRAATPAEQAEMSRRLDAAMRDGAFGLSSALIYPPGSYTSTEEIIALARVAAAHGGRYVTHVRGEGARLTTALDEALRIGREAGIPVVIYHLKIATRTRWQTMPAIVARIEAARAAGLDVSATAYPYPVAGTGLGACLPDWVHAGGQRAMLRRLVSRTTRARIRREIEHGHDGWENFLKSAGFDGVTIAAVPEGGDSSVIGLTLGEIARGQKRSPWDVFFDLLIAHDGRVSALYALMHEDDVRVVLRQPWVSIGSDSSAQPAAGPMAQGRPHPRGFGSFPRVLGHYVRELQVVELPEAIRRMTSFPAAQMGIEHRGQIREGYYADLVAFDRGTVADRATFDMPRQYPEGVPVVVVNGVVTVRAGRLTGARGGQALVATGAAARARAGTS